ncbi:hypothetical protein D3C76_1035520 [compost metagenome]
MPEPGRRLARPARLLKKLRQVQQALVAKQRHAAGVIVVAAGDLDQATAAIQLAVAIGLRAIAQTQGEAAGVITRQVAFTAQLFQITQLPGLVPDLRQESRHASRGINFPALHGSVQGRHKNARLLAGVGENRQQCFFSYFHKHLVCIANPFNAKCHACAAWRPWPWPCPACRHCTRTWLSSRKR